MLNSALIGEVEQVDRRVLDRCKVTAWPLLAPVKQHTKEACWNHSFETFQVNSKFNKPELSSTICTKAKTQFIMRHCLGLVWFTLYQQHFSDQFINSSLTWQAKQVLLNLKKRKQSDVKKKTKKTKPIQQTNKRKPNKNPTQSPA